MTKAVVGTREHGAASVAFVGELADMRGAAKGGVASVVIAAAEKMLLIWVIADLHTLVVIASVSLTGRSASKMEEVLAP